MTGYGPPRVLDASALVELFQGHPLLMQLLELAAAGKVVIAFPDVAIEEAAAVLDIEPALWDHFLRFPGVTVLSMGAHGAIAAGRYARPRVTNPIVHRELANPLQIGHVVQEAIHMSAIVVTAIPEAYAGHDLVVHELNLPPGGPVSNG
ncbi:hypothetical protein [Actinoplanes utahensis]|uniref:hypothetical protein n=1 Tax=Actinoplanes utahensis TaxID=1869 RepID=UPI00068D3518|nr:hypothetical protein [Actinoplanes utahensis]GIF31431.1 hypothetical protein Aut01nite_44170 [Actinoplanes utahensis]